MATSPMVFVLVVLGALLVAGAGLARASGPARTGSPSAPGRWPGASGKGRGARWAMRRDLKSLLVRSTAVPGGRLLLGRLPGVGGRPWVAAEAGHSLVVIGPTQSGKTSTLAVPAILDWPGPVVAASVKSDLLRDTRAARERRGTVWCIDPTACTGVTPAVWSPLPDCTTWPEARRTAAGLCEAAKGDGTTPDGDFWYATAAKFLAPLLYAAARDGRAMADVVRWVDTQEIEEVAGILEHVGPLEACDAAAATWCRDARTRSSVATTAETVLAPFADAPALRGGPAFEPGPLLEGPHTVYLCAPAHDQRRLRGYFTALTQQVLSHAFATATRRGPLDPPLLVVIDEAAHVAPLPELDGLAATCASHGIQLLTVWQDLAQVRGRYGARAPTVLNNHRAKLFLPGIADPDTLEYASRLVGDTEVPRPSVTRDPSGRRSTTTAADPRRLLPPEELRCLRRGTAVLVYGSLPPTRLRLRPWWDHRVGPRPRLARALTGRAAVPVASPGGRSTRSKRGSQHVQQR